MWWLLEMSSVRLWHSALLFILAIQACVSNTGANKTPPPVNYEIHLEDNNFYCLPSPDQRTNRSDIYFKWLLTPPPQIEEDNLLSSTNTLQLQDIQAVNKVECLASNHFGTSYAFMHLMNGTQLEKSDVTIDLEFESNVLACKCKNGACHTFKWIKNGAELISNREFAQVAVISSSEQQLEFTKPFFDANGTYGCLVNDADYQETIVNLGYQPSLTSSIGFTSAGLTTVPIGTNVTLTCSVRSQNTSVDFMWMLNNFRHDCSTEDECQIRSLSEFSTELFLPTVNAENSGMFKCVAYNLVQSASSEIQVEVHEDLPIILDINMTSDQGRHQISVNEYMLLENSELVLNCNHNGSSILWSLPNKEKVVDINPLVIDNVHMEEHQGTYLCTVSNSFGISVQSYVSVIIVQPSRIKESDQDQVLEVQPSSDPFKLVCDAIIDQRLVNSIYFQWSKDGFVLPSNQSELWIEQVSKDDAGIYTCSIQSDLKFLQPVEESWTVKVKQTPSIFPGFPSSMPMLTTQEKLTISCFAQGIPSPSMSWSKTDNYSLIYPRNVLSEMNADFDTKVDIDILQSGIYQCQASNDHGQALQAIEIIQVEPTLAYQDFTNNTAIEADAGHAITLNCSVRVDPKLEQFEQQVIWKRNNDILTSEGSMLWTIPYLVDREHSGTYTCHVQTAVDQLITSQILQVITQPPSIKFKPSDKLQKHPVGVNLTLACGESIDGIPKPSIQWKFNEAQQNALEEQLTLENLDAKQEGNYTCLAVNEYGSDTFNIQLEVIAPPKITEGPEDLTMKTLGMVVFPCKVQADPRVPSQIQWFFNQTQELSAKNKHQLIINQVTKEHQGFYTCLVTSSAYGVVNQTAELTVLGEPPTFIATEKRVRTIEGKKSAVLTCQANGMPLPKIFWQKQGINLTLDKVNQSLLGDLTIHDIAMTDQGTYQCFATNMYGTITTQVEMEVIRKSMPSDDQTLAREVVKNVHDNVTLNCGISFDPRLAKETKVQWFKQSQPVNLNLRQSSNRPDLKYIKLLNNSLLIHDLGVDDKGKYLCSVQTPYESLEYSVQLFVHGEPPKILSSFNAMTLYEGNDLKIACLAKGVPLPELKWLFNDKPLVGTYDVDELLTEEQGLKQSIISAKRVTKIHEGVYQCEAANTYGSGVAKFVTVNVITKTSVQISEEDISVHAGQILRIPCNHKTDPRNRINRIIWSMNDKDINVGPLDRVDFGMDGSISISNVQKRHSGIYKCTVNTTQDTASATVPVKVIVNAPVIVSGSEDQVMFSGNTISLLCKANGIPKPEIRWKFNNTETEKTGEDYIISNAILSDSGVYVCEASNQYGQTKQEIHVKVVHAAPLQTEYLVDLDHDLILPCFDYEPSLKVEATWRLDGRLLTGSQMLSNGSIHIQRMSEEQSGVYSCSALLPNGRRSFVQTSVRLRPDIILSQGRDLVVNEGEDVFLECLLVRGVHAKRVWQFNGEYEYGDRTKYENQGGLLRIPNVIPSDSGNYTCLAQKKSSTEQDTIEYKLTVNPTRPHWTPGEPHVTCGNVKDQSVSNLKAFKLNNDTVGITWSLPDYFNSSCYDHLAMTWWSNATESSFSEMQLPLDKVQIQLSGLEPDLTYYVQVNLIAPLNVQIYGHTLKFSLEKLPFGQLLEEDASNVEVQSYDDQPNTLVVVIITLVMVIISIVLVVCCVKWRQSQSSKNRFARNSVHLRHPSAVSVCCQCTTKSWCYGSGSTTNKKDDHMFQKTNFNGFDTGMYEAAIINTDSASSAVNSRLIVAPPTTNTAAAAVKRTSFVAVDKSGDFMSNLTPQWPEPEEAPLGQQEYDPFIRHHPSSFGDHHHHLQERARHGSKESISSSWSSLFNVPGTSSGTVSIRPNSVAVSNLSSSGSAADYAAKVAFIGNKYRKNT